MALASRLFFWDDWVEGGGEEFLGNPRIVYNGQTISFPHPPTAYLYERLADVEFGVSGGGVANTALHHQYDQIRVEMDHFDNRPFEQKLWAWWSWVVRGKAYEFALDDTETKDTVLNGAAAAGQKDLPMANTSGITVGKQYVVREIAGEEEELIEVASITTNVKVVAVDNLVYGYASGDIFRARDFFPKMVSDDKGKRPWIQNLTTFTLDHRAREDKG